MNWDDLDYWNSGEWQVIQEKLEDLEAAKIRYNPARENLFAALDAVDFDNVKVAIYGQDPYPSPKHACGIAFATPAGTSEIPQTLATILREYVNDLHYPDPHSPDLRKWCDQGVLLWNSIPTCNAFHSLSHEHWTEWTYLTKEITEKLDDKGIVFVMLGGKAKAYSKYVKNSSLFEYSHPSPRAGLHAKSPFLGSRMFTTVNAELVELKQEPIDWLL